jgi:hypothetical protein
MSSSPSTYSTTTTGKPTRATSNTHDDHPHHDNEQQHPTPPNKTPDPRSRPNPQRAPLPKPATLNSLRRTAFFHKIQSRRDDRRFEARGEDMMRWDFMRRQRAWEADREREAEEVASSIPDEEEEGEEEDAGIMRDAGEYDLPTTGNVRGASMGWPALRDGEVEEFVRDEEGEIEALLEFMPRDNKGGGGKNNGEDDEMSLWSDDADYDALFSEVLEREGQGEGQQAVMDEMDMS